MDHKNFCPCSAALIASTCAERIPFVGTSAASVATVEAATGAISGAIARLGASGETETPASLDAGTRPFPDSTSRLESDAAGFTVAAAGIAGETPTALADEFAEEFVTGAMRTAAPEEVTGCAPDTAGIARAGSELAAEFAVRAPPPRIFPPPPLPLPRVSPRTSPRNPASTSSIGANLRALIN